MDTVLLAIIIGLGVLNALTLLLLFRRRGAKPAAPKPADAAEQAAEPLPVKLSEEKIAALEAQTQAAFEQAVANASQRFNQDIAGTSQRLNDLIVRLTTGVVEDELSEYRKGLETARSSALASLQQMQQTVDQQQEALQGDMVAAVQKRQAELTQRMEAKFGTVVANYIVESLGQAVDLGAQRDYLLASLERNKEALKKDVTGEL